MARFVVCGSAVLTCGLLAPAFGQEAPRRLRDIHIETRDVFSAQEAEKRWFYWLGNALHVTSDPLMLQREIWLRPGDTISSHELAELERNLRLMDLFGDVKVSAADVGTDEIDLFVRSRDRLTLTAGAAASVVGGVGEINGALGESNLFGTGKAISSEFSESDNGERRVRVRFTDPQLLGTWHRLSVNGGETEEGAFAGFSIARPVKHLADPWSYGVSGSAFEHQVDYYTRGTSVAEVPETRRTLQMQLTRTSGPRDIRRSLGIDLRLRDSSYSTALGPSAGLVRTPADVTELQLGPVFRVDFTHSYRKVVGLDTLDYTEDLRLGVSGQVRLAGVLRDEDNRSAEVQSLVELQVTSASEPFEDLYLTTNAFGVLRFNRDSAQGWQASLALHAFDLSPPFQTLAGSLTFDAAAESQDLQPEFTLGEDNGLRGYPAREFSGTRMVRLNLEDRIHTNLQFLSIHLGFAAFFDAAWIHSSRTGMTMHDAITSAGVGLRFGSSNLVGNNVLRIDIAWPLSDVNGVDYGVSISVSTGQVFSFFGNNTELSSEFGR